MSNRGDYRPIYAALTRADEFKALSKDGKLLFYGLKLLLGPSGIDEAYDEQIADRSGLEMHEVEPARQELIDAEWIEVEGRIHWIRNGLRFEPNISLSHAKQRAGIERHLQGLPKSPVVNRMAADYGLEPPFPDTPPEGSRKPPESLSKGSGFKEKEKEPLKEPLKEPSREKEGKPLGKASKGQRARAWKFVPEDWEPTEKHAKLAKHLNVNLATEEAKFRDHEFKDPKTDADRAFSRWLRTAPQYAASGSGRSDTGIVKRHEPAQPDDRPPASAKERERGLALVRDAVKAVTR